MTAPASSDINYVVTILEGDEPFAYLVPGEELHALLEVVTEPFSIVLDGMGLFGHVLPLEAVTVPYSGAYRIADVSDRAARLVATRLCVSGEHHVWLERVRRVDDQLARDFFDRRERALVEREARAAALVRQEEFGRARSHARMTVAAAQEELAAWRRIGGATWPDAVVRTP